MGRSGCEMSQCAGNTRGREVARVGALSEGMWERELTLGSRRGEVMRFSTQRMTPSFVRMPMAVEPSCNNSVQKGVKRTAYLH